MMRDPNSQAALAAAGLSAPESMNAAA
jgi:hypothetical protein